MTHRLAVPRGRAWGKGVGCNDIPTSSWVSPALTSIAFPRYELGATAARMILQMVQGLPPQEHVVFPLQIHVRASSVRG
jgi:DNA-binding LacI/PurR family transcriptional regulator